MKQISIDFRNMWGGFFGHDNIVTNTLSLEYDVVVDAQNPDIVICQVTPQSHGAPPPEQLIQDRIGKSKIIYWLVESIDRTGEPDYSQCDFSFSSCCFDDERNVRIPLWAMYVNWFGGREDSYVEGRNQAFLVSPDKLLKPQIHTPKKKFCCVLTNNDMGLRKDIYPRFINFGVENGLLVESRGRYLTNMSPIGDDERHKLEYIDDFKFNLCYDNGEADGWVTEKLIHPIYQGVIPIYWGCPSVGREFNENRFIHARDFECAEQLFDTILEVWNSEKRFQEIQSQPCFPDNRVPDCANPEYIIEELKSVVES